MAFLTDSLRGAIARIMPFGAASNAGRLAPLYSHDIAILAYASSGMLKKVITKPAAARTEKWRDWQADKDAIALIEAEEKRLNLAAKTKQAEVLRGVGGGAMILVTEGDHAEPLDPETIRERGLIAINVVSRWEINPTDFDRELTSPTFGEPRMFEVRSAGVGTAKVHPSRVVAFRGEPLPRGQSGAIDEVEAYWGDSRLLSVFNEVRRSDDTQEWFSLLVKKAKVLRVGIPNLTDFTASEEGRGKLNSRVQLIAECESILNAVVFDKGNGTENPGEEITDYQVNWSGIPAVIDSFDQHVAAVSNIPFTILMGRSPAGMNSTGEHDMETWRDTVSNGQETETRPCLERIDPLLLRSAGITKPDDVWWQWAPLDTPDEKEEAETFKLLMEAVNQLMDSGLVPSVALSQAVQNLIEENGYLPGLADALSKLSEEERFNVEQPDDDPSAMQAGEEDPEEPTPRAANDQRFLADAAPRTLYVQRKVLNAAEIIRWAKSQGLETTLPAEDMHVTVAFSRTPVDWFAVGTDWSGDENGLLRVKPGGPRAVERLGDGGAVALLFQNDDLGWRHRRILEVGASWDWPEYRPHITLSWNADGVDVAQIEPYTGPIVLGPELFAEVQEDWKEGVKEK